MENASELNVKYKIFPTQYSSNYQPITVKNIHKGSQPVGKRRYRSSMYNITTATHKMTKLQ